MYFKFNKYLFLYCWKDKYGDLEILGDNVFRWFIDCSKRVMGLGSVYSGGGYVWERRSVFYLFLL